MSCTCCALPPSDPSPHNGKPAQAIAASGSLAVSPPSRITSSAPIAALRAPFSARRVPEHARIVVPPSAPERIAVTVSTASSEAANSLCTTVAQGGLPVNTVTAPKSAGANHSPNAKRAAFHTPLVSPNDPLPRVRHVVITNHAIEAKSAMARYRCMTSMTRSMRSNGGNQNP